MQCLRCSKTIPRGIRYCAYCGDMIGNIRPRNPFAAAFLGLIIPGLGLVYAGKLRLAIYVHVFFIVTTFIIAWSGFIKAPIGLYSNFLLILLWYFVLAIASFVFVLINKRACPMYRYQRMHWYALYICFVLSVQYVFTTQRPYLFGFDVMRMAGGGMEPFLLDGDFYLVDTSAYTNNQPSPGDIVMFGSQTHPDTVLISRVVAVKTNSISVRNNVRSLNDLPRENLIGKGTYIWMSYEKGYGVRWERIGNYANSAPLRQPTRDRPVQPPTPEETHRALPTLVVKGEIALVESTDLNAVAIKVMDRYGFVTPIILNVETKILAPPKDHFLGGPLQWEQELTFKDLKRGTAVEVEYLFDPNTAKRHAVLVRVPTLYTEDTEPVL